MTQQPPASLVLHIQITLIIAHAKIGNYKFLITLNTCSIKKNCKWIAFFCTRFPPLTRVIFCLDSLLLFIDFLCNPEADSFYIKFHTCFRKIKDLHLFWKWEIILETELLIFIVILSPPVVLNMQKRFIIIAIENKTRKEK